MRLFAALRRVAGPSGSGFIIGAATLIGCASCQENRQGVLPNSTAPAALGDGWEVSTPLAEQLDASRLTALEQSLIAGDFAAPDALLIARNGRLIYEQYWNGFAPQRRHDLRSATKSITSLLIGLAVQEKRIATLDAAVAPFFPEYQALLSRDPRMQRITLAHLLTMSSGLDCDDWNAESPGAEDKMYKTRDWLGFVFGLPMLGEPGSRTTYCTGGVAVLGGVLARATATPVPEYAQRTLFAPLQIRDVKWADAPPSGTDTGGHLELRPRDLLKVGQLILDGGRWRGTQVIDESRITEAVKPRVHLGDSDYAQLWWRNTFRVSGVPFDAIFARGNGGQYLFSFPAQQLTVLFMGSHYNSDVGNNQPLELCGRFVLSALMPQ